MNMYLLFGEVFKYLIPKPIRGDKQVAWMFALLEPLQSLNIVYRDWVANIRYEMGFNGQCIYLEHYLNDVFDPVQRRIYIDDPANTALQSSYLYNVIEAQTPIYIYNLVENQPLIVYNRSELVSTDFVVYIPVDLIMFISTRIYAILNKYRLTGKQYKIQFL